MNIIKTDVVSPANDVMWNDVDALIANCDSKPVLIVTNDYTDGSADDVQLQKMLGACKLTGDKYNIIKLKDGQTAAWHKLHDRLKPGIVFLIGVLPAQLGISALFNLNSPNNFDGTIWLPTLSVSDLAKHDDMKKQLWVNGMKPLFVDRPLPSPADN
jgi:hypothetical protein